MGLSKDQQQAVGESGMLLADMVTQSMQFQAQIKGYMADMKATQKQRMQQLGSAIGDRLHNLNIAYEQATIDNSMISKQAAASRDMLAMANAGSNLKGISKDELAGQVDRGIMEDRAAVDRKKNLTVFAANNQYQQVSQSIMLDIQNQQIPDWAAQATAQVISNVGKASMTAAKAFAGGE